ncbi:alpha/beta fold hydrolase [Leptospira ognonensis]|nr:alpha/beta hydrolase [Leptospira ognonensis]
MFSFFFNSLYRLYQYQRSKSMKNMGGIPRYVDLGGHSIFYWEFNAEHAKPIIFLHGLLDEGFSNRRIVRELLGDRKHILVFDLPGYGRSKLPKIKYLFQIDVWADLLLASFKTLGLKDIHLVGHSMGGLVSQHLVLKDKEKRISKLVLLAPGGMPHPKREEIRELLFPKTEKSVVALLHHLYGDEAPEPGYLMRKTLVTVWNGWENHFLQENTLEREDEIFHGKRVGDIKIPTLILAGSLDEITPPSMMNQMNRWIKRSKLVWLEGARHAIHLERPKEIAQQILKFTHR